MIVVRRVRLEDLLDRAGIGQVRQVIDHQLLAVIADDPVLDRRRAEIGTGRTRRSRRWMISMCNRPRKPHRSRTRALGRLELVGEAGVVGGRSGRATPRSSNSSAVRRGAGHRTPSACRVPGSPAGLPGRVGVVGDRLTQVGLSAIADAAVVPTSRGRAGETAGLSGGADAPPQSASLHRADAMNLRAGPGAAVAVHGRTRRPPRYWSECGDRDPGPAGGASASPSGAGMRSSPPSSRSSTPPVLAEMRSTSSAGIPRTCSRSPGRRCRITRREVDLVETAAISRSFSSARAG